MKSVKTQKNQRKKGLHNLNFFIEMNYQVTKRIVYSLFIVTQSEKETLF